MERLSTQVESQKGKNLEVEWRRSKVIELNSQGYSQPETAKILQIGLGTVNRDLYCNQTKSKKEPGGTYSAKTTVQLNNSHKNMGGWG
jgi:hypothetical protein